MRTTLRFNIVTNFILLIVLVTSLLLGLQYYSGHKIASEAIDKSFEQTINNITLFTKTSEKSVGKALRLLSFNDDISTKVNINTEHPMQDDFVEVLSQYQALRAIYIGYENGDFYEVLNLKKLPSIVAKHGAPSESIWGVYTIAHNKNTTESNFKFLNANLEVLLSTEADSLFDIKKRPWFKEAISSSKLIRTNIYEFKDAKASGITFAKHIANKNVVIALDLTLNDLEDFIKKQVVDEDSHIMLYSDKGELLAESNEKKSYKWDNLFTYFKNHKSDMTHKYIHNGTEYFIYHTFSKESKGHINIGITMPKEKLLAPYMKEITHSLYAALIFVLLSIPVAFHLSSVIVKPIRSLMHENEKITNRDFANVQDIQTSILELHQLSGSLVSMSLSIQEYQKSQEKLLDSIIKVLANAIDAKSAYTGGHCRRVPEIAQKLTKVASDTQDGVFKEFSFESEDEWREFHIGAWLHDCGKVTTPEYVVDKSTKLETIYNRIHEIRTRFEVLYRDAQIVYLEEQLHNKDKKQSLEKLHATQNKLIEEFEFLASANMGGEYMSEEKQERIKSIAKREWTRNFDDRLGLADVELLRYEGIEAQQTPVIERLLNDKQEHLIKRVNFDYESYKADGFKEEVPQYLYNYGEIYNLCVEKGTLTHEERFKINEHVIMTIKMLEQIPFPSQLNKIPEYAGTHHETMIGTGYPRKLSKKDLSVPARIMALADIFEALTASDRPYKKAKTLSESLKIMSFMVKDEHIDGDIFELFLTSGVYLEYAKAHLKPEHIDEVKIENYISM